MESSSVLHDCADEGTLFRQGAGRRDRADTLSILAFEIGFAWMAVSYYALFPSPHLKPTEAVFWFMMQVGMTIGFFTSYPANIALIKKGWKERMPGSKEEMRERMREQQNRQEAA